MRFIREHVFYVVLIAVTVVAGGVALGYYFTSGVSAKLRRRTKLAGSLNSLAKQREQVKAEAVSKLKKRIETIRTGAKKDANDAVSFNSRNLPVLKLTVSPGRTEPAFPIDEQHYGEEGLYYTFIKQYTKSLDEMVNNPVLKRTTRSTEQEVKLEEVRLKDRFKEQAYSQAVVSMRIKKAEQGMVFVDDDALDRYFTRETKAPGERLWEAQVNLWVTREVLQAIITTNEDLATARKAAGVGRAEADVLSSAVKRLAKIDIAERFIVPGGGGGFGGTAQKGNFTQRASTDEYGMVGYQFVVVMPTRHIAKLLRNLMAQNYHSVLSVAMTDLRPEKKTPYYYGTEPVATVTVRAAMLILTKWARPLMPPTVAQRLPPAPTSG
jgi:hypothetical protein